MVMQVMMNEDGTLMSDGFPENPLKKKWDKLYPPTPNESLMQVCDGNSCLWCGRCPSGQLWTIPDEDREIYNKYRLEVQEYHKKHNPNLCAAIGLI